MRKFLLIVLSCLLYTTALFSNEAAFLSLEGHIDQEKVDQAKKLLERASKGQLIIRINSTSGEILAVLELAKKIYEWKQEKGLYLIVYMEDNALGPVAMLPFLANELYISHSVSWGDIPLGTFQEMATNVLRNRVSSFIDPDQPQARLLDLLASAMTDPSVEIVEGKEGWRMVDKEKDSSLPRLSSPGQPLVVNQNQLEQLKLVKAILSPEKFLAQFGLAPKEETVLKPAVTQPETVAKTVLEQLKAHIHFQETVPNKVGIITIDDRTSGINEATWIYVKNALEFYKQEKPIFLILMLNTPGGEVYAAQKISDALRELDTQLNIPVVAFINNWAISAGAMLAFSCRFIVVVADAAMGAAEPLEVGSSGETKVASEKVNSALRADFGNRAGLFGRNRALAEAMVDKDIILVYRYGKIVRLDHENQIRTTGPDRDVVISAKGKLLTLNSEQMWQYGVADLVIPQSKLEPITQQEKEVGEWPFSKELLSTASFFKDIPHVVIKAYQLDWKTRFFMLLAHPVVSSLLMMGLVVGIYMELSSPGFGLPGTIAATSLFLIVLSSFSQEIGGWLELILTLTGLGVLLIEIFVLPSFGLLGFIGLLLFLAGLFGLMLPGIEAMRYEFDTNTLNAAGEAFLNRLIWLTGAFLLACGIIFLLARYVTPAFAGFSRLVLTGNEQVGYIAGESPQKLPQPGSEGEAVSTLRPAGKVLIGEELYDALSRGAFIEKGAKVIVESLEGSTIIVREK